MTRLPTMPRWRTASLYFYRSNHIRLTAGIALRHRRHTGAVSLNNIASLCGGSSGCRCCTGALWQRCTGMTLLFCPCHAPACLCTLTACFSTPLAMIHLMLRAFGDACVADRCACAADVCNRCAFAGDEAGRHATNLRAVDIECDAAGHRLGVFIQTRCGTQVARRCTTIARIDTSLDVSSVHLVLC